MNKKILFIFSILLLSLFYILELKYITFLNKIHKSPYLINLWEPKIKSIRNVTIYDNLLIIDSLDKKLKIYDKFTGKEKNIIYFDELNPLCAAEDKNNNIFIIFENYPFIYKYVIKKLVDKIKIDFIPCFIVIDKDENFFILDKNTSQIYKYNKNFILIRIFGGFGKLKEQFKTIPQYMTIGGDGLFYTKEIHLNNIIIKSFDLNGNFIRDIRIKQKNTVNYSGLAIDKNGNIYIENSTDLNFLIYNKYGKLIGFFKDDAKKIIKFFRFPLIIGFDDDYIFASEPYILIFKALNF